MDLMKKEELRAALKQAKEIEPEFIEICHVMANQMKHFYNALIDKDFTEEQAIKIIMVQGASPGNYNGSVE